MSIKIFSTLIVPFDCLIVDTFFGFSDFSGIDFSALTFYMYKWYD